MTNRTIFRRLAPLALCSALLFSTGAYAELWDKGPEEGRFDKRRDEKMEKRREEKTRELDEKLGLSSEQKAKLTAHRAKTREEARRLHDLLGQKRDALRDELEKSDLDMARIKSLNAEIKDLGGQIVDHRLNSVLEVRQILTPEQFKKFHELREKRREAREPGRPE